MFSCIMLLCFFPSHFMSVLSSFVSLIVWSSFLLVLNESFFWKHFVVYNLVSPLLITSSGRPVQTFMPPVCFAVSTGSLSLSYLRWLHQGFTQQYPSLCTTLVGDRYWAERGPVQMSQGRLAYIGGLAWWHRHGNGPHLQGQARHVFAEKAFKLGVCIQQWHINSLTETALDIYQHVYIIIYSSAILKVEEKISHDCQWSIKNCRSIWIIY